MLMIKFMNDSFVWNNTDYEWEGEQEELVLFLNSLVPVEEFTAYTPLRDNGIEGVVLEALKKAIPSIEVTVFKPEEVDEIEEGIVI